MLEQDSPQAISLCIHFTDDKTETQRREMNPATLSWAGKDAEGSRGPAGDTQHTVHLEGSLLVYIRVALDSPRTPSHGGSQAPRGRVGGLEKVILPLKKEKGKKTQLMFFSVSYPKLQV